MSSLSAQLAFASLADHADPEATWRFAGGRSSLLALHLHVRRDSSAEPLRGVWGHLIEVSPDGQCNRPELRNPALLHLRCLAVAVWVMC